MDAPPFSGLEGRQIFYTGPTEIFIATVSNSRSATLKRSQMKQDRFTGLWHAKIEWLASLLHVGR